MLHINKNSKYLGYSQITVFDELPGGAAPATCHPRLGGACEATGRVQRAGGGRRCRPTRQLPTSTNGPGRRLLEAQVILPLEKRRRVPSKTAVFGSTLGKKHEGSTTFPANSPMTYQINGPGVAGPQE